MIKINVIAGHVDDMTDENNASTNAYLLEEINRAGGTRAKSTSKVDVRAALKTLPLTRRFSVLVVETDEETTNEGRWIWCGTANRRGHISLRPIAY